MELKNEFVKEVLSCGEKGNEEFKRRVLEKTISSKESVQFMLGGYFTALEDGAELVGKELDLSYESVRDISAALIGLANLQKDDYLPQKNAFVTLKTLAAYLILLAAENHGYSVSVKKGIGSKYPYKNAMWADMFYLELGGKKNSDLLPAAVRAAESAPFEVENGLALNVVPLIEAYKKLTGVNLEELGLANVVVQFAD